MASITRRNLFKGVLATIALASIPKAIIEAATQQEPEIVSNASGTLWGSNTWTVEEMSALRRASSNSFFWRDRLWFISSSRPEILYFSKVSDPAIWVETKPKRRRRKHG